MKLFLMMCVCAISVAQAEEVTNAAFEGLSYSSSSAASVRLDTRTSFGGRLVRGVEKRGTPDGSGTVSWNTAQEANGWQTLTDGGQSVDVAIQNDPLIAIEGGRLAENTLWSNDVVHVVRNWVTVPNGVTLTIKPETIIKFTENSGILVEEGGTLDMRTSAVFTQTMDDTVGGDTDMRVLVNKRQNAQIYAQPGGNILCLGLAETRFVHVSTYGNISVNVAQCLEQEGRVFAQFSFTGTRPETFSCDFTTEDGSALAGSDYTTTANRISHPRMRATSG